VDGRAQSAYRQAHIPGALHIPFTDLAARSDELDADELVVLYTWFQREVEGLDAALALYRIGFSQVAVLDGGIQAWDQDGHAMEGPGWTPEPDDVNPPWRLTPLVTADLLVTGTVTTTVVPVESETVAPTRVSGE
jgi:rhodanese-related sulfurtransferase